MSAKDKEKERYQRLLHASQNQAPGVTPAEHANRILRVLQQLTARKHK